MGRRWPDARRDRGAAPHAVTASAEHRAAPASDAVRGAVTLALAAYLLGLLLSIAANSSSGASALVSALHGRLFSPWMVPPWLDLGFDYGLTRGLPEDADHRLLVSGRGAAAPALEFPATGMTGQRAARWRRLARAVAVDDADPSGTSVLATGMAEGLFSRVGADDLEVVVFRDPFPERGTAPRSTPEKVSTVRLRRGPAGLQLIRTSDPEELAPLLRPAPPLEGKGR